MPQKTKKGTLGHCLQIRGELTPKEGPSHQPGPRGGSCLSLPATPPAACIRPASPAVPLTASRCSHPQSRRAGPCGRGTRWSTAAAARSGLGGSGWGETDEPHGPSQRPWRAEASGLQPRALLCTPRSLAGPVLSFRIQICCHTFKNFS